MAKRFVYVIAVGDGPIKVGIATNVRDRLMTLQAGNHRELVAVHAVEVSEPQAVEATVHRLLADHWVRGEWFDVEPNVALAAIHEAIALVLRGAPPRHEAWKLVNLKVEHEVLARIDAEAARRGMTRSAYMIACADPCGNVTILPKRGGSA